MATIATVTVTVSGGIRRAAAAINGTAIQCHTNADGDQEGSGSVDVSSKRLEIGLTVNGAPGTAFTSTFAVEGKGSAEKKGRMKTDVAVRGYTIPFDELEK